VLKTDNKICSSVSPWHCSYNWKRQPCIKLHTFKQKKKKKKKKKIAFGQCFTNLHLLALQTLKNGVWLYISCEFLNEVKAGLTPLGWRVWGQRADQNLNLRTAQCIKAHEELRTVYFLPVIWSEQIYIIIIIIIIIAGQGTHGVRNVYKCLLDNHTKQRLQRR